VSAGAALGKQRGVEDLVPDRRMQVADTILTAFRQVSLGNGVGLSEADGLGDHATPERLLELRSNDEKSDWSRIPACDLNTYWWGISHFDAAGMRFHLPAYMIADLNGNLDQDITFHLTRRLPGRFAEFTSAQKGAVLQYLEWCITQCEYPDEPIAEDIRQAIQNYWGRPA
jgi:hypothetical protein